MARTRTPERIEFLTDLMTSCLAAANYWAQVESEDGGTVTIVDLEDEHREHTVTLDTIARGINLLSKQDMNYNNMGYDRSSYGKTRARIGLFNRTNGRDSDTDAWDYDAMLQCGVFGKVIYS